MRTEICFFSCLRPLRFLAGAVFSKSNSGCCGRVRWWWWSPSLVVFVSVSVWLCHVGVLQFLGGENSHI